MDTKRNIFMIMDKALHVGRCGVKDIVFMVWRPSKSNMNYFFERGVILLYTLSNFYIVSGVYIFQTGMLYM
jgi:hypothetical protein